MNLCIPQGRLAALLGAALLAGCAGNPYIDAKRRTAAGGELDQQQAAADARLADEQRRNVALQGQKTSVDTEVARNAQRIGALQNDLKRQDAQLAAALKARQVDKTRYDQLKRQLNDLQADTQRADMDNRGAALSKSPGADAAKQAELADLEKRKKALEDALAALTKR